MKNSREQVAAILWAQFRITRNHFPRTSLGTLLSWSVSAIWYLLFVAMAVLIARVLKAAPVEDLPFALSVGLLAVFAYMLVVPLVTLSSGWSLQLDKLQAFPISDNMLFLIEVVLRITSSPEMLILLGGGFVGLALRGDVFPLAPLSLLFLVSFALFLQLAIRDFILHSFSRSRLRELMALLLISLSLLPQLFLHEKTFLALKPYLVGFGTWRFTPWHLIAVHSLGRYSPSGVALILAWNVAAMVTARTQFMKSLRREDSFRPAAVGTKSLLRGVNLIARMTGWISDPLGALVEKELRTLLRMPRFRISLGMACIFSSLLFLPVALGTRSNSFLGQNALPVTSLYGLLLLSDVLLMNIFGFDRGATQLYFVTPLSISTVLRAKNLAALFFVALQSLAVPALLLLFRVKFSSLSFGAGLLSAGVVTVFLLAAGNLLSVFLPRPIDPRTSFKQQSGGRAQFWLIGCTFGIFGLVSMAYLARWATDRDWVLVAVLGLETAIGLLVYRISLESTVERALEQRESIVTALSRSASPLSS